MNLLKKISFPLFLLTSTTAVIAALLKQKDSFWGDVLIFSASASAMLIQVLLLAFTPSTDKKRTVGIFRLTFFLGMLNAYVAGLGIAMHWNSMAEILPFALYLLLASAVLFLLNVRMFNKPENRRATLRFIYTPTLMVGIFLLVVLLRQ